MALSQAQLQTLKADIAADPVLAAQPLTPDGNKAIADAYNLLADPAYWVWRSSVTRAEVYYAASPTGSVWDWATYKNQGVAEQGAWEQMYQADAAPFSNVKLREGIGKIFTGSAQANAQRDHCLAIGRRPAKRGEKLYALPVLTPPLNTGNVPTDPRGSPTNPDVMAVEGNITTADVEQARELP